MAKLVIGTDKTVGVPAIVKEVEKQEKYSLLSRVKDDSNHDVGIVVGYHTDANSQKYAVVCLNKEYRTSSSFTWLNGAEVVDGLPAYTNLAVFDAKETATYNCDKILSYAQEHGYTSTATNECRNHSFIIDGVTYYGQLPTLTELINILEHRSVVNRDDPSSSGASIQSTYNYWSSQQNSTTHAWAVGGYSGYLLFSRDAGLVRVLPILEIPIN